VRAVALSAADSWPPAAAEWWLDALTAPEASSSERARKVVDKVVSADEEFDLLGLKGAGAARRARVADLALNTEGFCEALCAAAAAARAERPPRSAAARLCEHLASVAARVCQPRSEYGYVVVVATA